MMTKRISIDLEADGWSIRLGDDPTVYHWNHNEQDLGTGALKNLFEDLGYEVSVEEVY